MTVFGVIALYVGFFVFKKAFSIGFVVYGLASISVAIAGFQEQQYCLFINFLYFAALLGVIFFTFFKQIQLSNSHKDEYRSFFVGSLQEWLSALSIFVLGSLLISLFFCFFSSSIDSDVYHKAESEFFKDIYSDDYDSAHSDVYIQRKAEWEKTDVFLIWDAHQSRQKVKYMIIHEVLFLFFSYVGSFLNPAIIGASFVGLSLLCVFKSFIWGGFCEQSFMLLKLFFVVMNFVFMVFYYRRLSND